jgi:hypothetical protein
VNTLPTATEANSRLMQAFVEIVMALVEAVMVRGHGRHRFHVPHQEARQVETGGWCPLQDIHVIVTRLNLPINAAGRGGSIFLAR